MTTITITQPDDWHIHLRDDDYLKTTVSHAARYLGRIMVMPNLIPPITTVARALAYHEAISSHVSGHTLTPLMTLYLTDTTTDEDIIAAKQSGLIFGCKLYPAGSTTNSTNGVTQLGKLEPALNTMQEQGIPLLIHGEVTHQDVDIYDREARFLDETLEPLLRKYPKLRIVLEHITTEEAVEFVKAAPKNVAATITAHHLLLNRNDMLVGGIRPHYFCLPILKRQRHQEALLAAAISGNKKYFMGTDSAPHSLEKKESSCGCAGVYTGHAPVELYAEAFDKANALNQLEAFCSFNGPDFYQLPRNTKKITFQKISWRVPDFYPFANSKLVPFRAGELIHWKQVDE